MGKIGLMFMQAKELESKTEQELFEMLLEQFKKKDFSTSTFYSGKNLSDEEARTFVDQRVNAFLESVNAGNEIYSKSSFAGNPRRHAIFCLYFFPNDFLKNFGFPNPYAEIY